MWYTVTEKEIVVMRKINALLAIACIALATTGCKNTVFNPVPEEEPVNPVGQETEEAPQNAVGGRPEIFCSKEYLFEEAYADGVYTDPYLTGHYDKYVLSPETKDAYPALTETFEASMSDRVMKYQELHDEYLDVSKQQRESGAVNTFILESDLFMRRADEKVISFMDQCSEYAAGAHGYTGYNSYNFDVQTGKELSLEDVLTNKEAFQKELFKILTDKYGASEFNYDLDNILSRMSLDEYKWAFDSNGITFYFANDIAAYAAGVLTVSMPYDSTLFKQDYVPDSKVGYISEIPLYFPDSYHMDIVDGQEDNITITPNYDPENPDMYYIQSLTINKDGETFTTDDLYIWDVDAFIIHTPDGKENLMIMTTGDSDYNCSYVYSLDGKIQQVSNDYFDQGETGTTDDYYEIVPCDPANVAFASRFDMLCTFDGTRYYSFESDGTFTPSEKFYKAMISEHSDLISKVELTVPVVDEAGEETGDEVTLPAGETYSIIRTDGEDEVDCKIKDGRIIRFHLEDPTGEGYVSDIEINGMNAEDVFETLWYAG